MVPAATRAAWKKNRLSNDKRILELVKLAVDSKGLVNVWRRELAWVFGVWGSSYRMHSRLIVAGRPGTGYSCGADAVGSGSRACPHTTGGRLDSVGFKTETCYVQAGDDDVVDIHRGYSRGGDGKVDTT